MIERITTGIIFAAIAIGLPTVILVTAGERPWQDSAAMFALWAGSIGFLAVIGSTDQP